MNIMKFKRMKKAQIFHNPTAGDGTHSKKVVKKIVKRAGYRVDYISTKKKHFLKNFKPYELDAIFVAGGDGTVHKLAEALVNKMPDSQIPIYLIPFGTANNIAKTIQNLGADGLMKVDYGRVKGLPKDQLFFESAGFGIFPELIFEMEKKSEKDVPYYELKQAVDKLQEIIRKIKAVKATLKVDGQIITGYFLLVEVMNIPFLGPNLHIAPSANPGDGYLELILVDEQYRQDLLDYLTNNSYNNTESLNLKNFVKTYSVKKLQIECEAVKMHYDDQLVDDYIGQTLEIESVPSQLKFLLNN